MNIRKLISKSKFLKSMILKAMKLAEEIKCFFSTFKTFLVMDKKAKSIFYIGVPAHKNLGDLAQGVCIREWIKENYPDFQVVPLETNGLVNTRFSLIHKLKKHFKEEHDFIIFQSGYTITDLGGYADIMHRTVISLLPNARILMMPQTIFFQNNENQMRTAANHNSAKNMLLMARDEVSYEMALSMFPNLKIELYPDIVTTLIGTYRYEYAKSGVLFCCRNDVEKFYPDDEINDLMMKISNVERVEKTDTTKNIRASKMVKEAKFYMEKEIDHYAKFKLLITDRYHGTIFSLIAGTPVIIIKSTDHKVTTGAKWFEGVYDDYVYVADSLDDAHELALQILKKDLSHEMTPHFKQLYYDKLKFLFESMNPYKN